MSLPQFWVPDDDKLAKAARNSAELKYRVLILHVKEMDVLAEKVRRKALEWSIIEQCLGALSRKSSEVENSITRSIGNIKVSQKNIGQYKENISARSIKVKSLENELNFL